MRTSVKLFAVLGVALVALIVGVWQGWLKPGSEKVQAVSTVPETPAATDSIPAPTPLEPLKPRSSQKSGQGTASADPGEMSVASDALVATLDDIIVAETDHTQKVAQIMALLPRLPEQDQPEAAQHIANLVPDENYGMISSMVTNAHSKTEVIDVLLTDLLNRKESLKLPMLLEIARHAEHPSATEARDILHIYLDADHGNDWNAWSQALDKWLKENPE